MKRKLLHLATLITLFSTMVWGQISISTLGNDYTQNFNTLASSGTSNTWTDNSTISGWYSNRVVYIADPGSNTTGGLHSYGSDGTDRAIGGLSSGSASPTFAVRLVNNTGSTVTEIDISFIGEQWRQTTNAHILTFEYQIGATDISSGTWTSISALNFTALKTGTAGALDGNASGNFSNITSTIATSLTNGQEIWLRWSKTGSTSPALAIDDFSVSFNVSGSPVLSVNPTSFSGLNYIENSGPSSSQSYDLSGSNLTPSDDDITVTGSTNYEVSDNNSTFSSSVVVPYTGGTLSATTIYVRLKSGLTAGNYNSETITNAGGGATTQNVTASGTVYKQEPTNHVTSFASVGGSPSHTAISLSWTDASGATVPDGYLIKGSTTSFAAISDPVDGTAESDAALVKNIAQGTQSASITGLSASTTYYFKIYPYANSSSNINYKTDGSVPTTSLTTGAPPAASLLLGEDFDFSGNLTSNGWTAHSGGGTTPIQTTTGLTYSGYANSGIGNAANVVGTGEDLNIGFTEQNSNGSSVYLSFLTNVTEAGNNLSAFYFMHLGDRSSPTSFSTFCARVFVAVDASNNVQFGIANGSTATLSATNYVKNTTYLLIIKYTINTSGNDEVKLWVKSSGVPTDETSAGTADVTVISETGQDIIDAVGIRQGSGLADIVVDGIRVSTAWSQSPLPVELTSFTAIAKGRGVELAWKTATELNNVGFEVEKNVAGTWNKIGFVEGNGTTNAPKSYTFVDASAKGNVSYRLKQIDRDGKFDYSPTVEANVALTAEDYSLTQNYPNPFNPSTTFSFATKNAEHVNVTVYNSLGQAVATLFNGIANPNELYSLNFDGKNLSSGTYFYALRSATRNEVRKMSLMK